MHRIAIAGLLLLGCDKPAPAPASGSAIAPAPTKPAEPPKPEPTNTDVKGPEKPALALAELNPPQGNSEGGTYVVLKGTGFTTTPRMAKVYFGDKQGQVVRFQSDRELIVMAPGGTVGEKVDVKIVFEPGGELTLPAAFEFVKKDL